MWNENMPKLIVDNDAEKEEKLSDVFMVTKEFHTSAEFSQHIERKAVAAGNYIDVLVEYCTRNEIEIESVKKLLTGTPFSEAVNLTVKSMSRACGQRYV